MPHILCYHRCIGKHRLIATDISLRPGETIVDEINAKPLTHELKYKPEDVQKTVREMLWGLHGKDL